MAFGYIFGCKLKNVETGGMTSRRERDDSKIGLELMVLIIENWCGFNSFIVSKMKMKEGRKLRWERSTWVQSFQYLIINYYQ